MCDKINKDTDIPGYTSKTIEVYVAMQKFAYVTAIDTYIHVHI